MAGCPQPVAVGVSYVALAKKEALDIRSRNSLPNGNEYGEQHKPKPPRTHPEQRGQKTQACVKTGAQL